MCYFVLKQYKVESYLLSNILALPYEWTFGTAQMFAKHIKANLSRWKPNPFIDHNFKCGYVNKIASIANQSSTASWAGF